MRELTEQVRETGVSPVVGVILMVAVTVVLSATVGLFVFNLQPPSSGGSQSAVTIDSQPYGVSITPVTVSEPLSIRTDGVTVYDLNSSDVGSTFRVPAAEGETITVLREADNGKKTVLTTHTVSRTSATFAYYKLDQIAGGTIRDAGPANRTATLTGNATVVNTGVIDEAVLFDGDDYFVESSAGRGVDEVTMTAWIYPTTWSDPGDPGNFDVVVDSSNSMLRRHGDSFRFVVKPNGSWEGVGINLSKMPADRWYFVAGTYDGETVRLTVNGTANFSVSKSASGEARLGGTYIGTESWHPDVRAFNGRVDGLRIYSTALSNQSINALYRKGNRSLNATG